SLFPRESFVPGIRPTIAESIATTRPLHLLAVDSRGLRVSTGLCRHAATGAGRGVLLGSVAASFDGLSRSPANGGICHSARHNAVRLERIGRASRGGGAGV